MKKVKFLAVVMVAALMLMGAGYAWWTDNITLTKTVNMGEFDVTVRDAAVEFTANKCCDGVTDVATVTIDPSVDNNDAYTVTIGNAYPGLEGELSFKVYNVGTIPAKLTATSVTPSASNVGDLLDHIDFNFLYNKDGVSDNYVLGGAGYYGGDYVALRTALADSNNPLLAECIAPDYTTTANTTENDGKPGSYFELKLPFRIDNFNDHEADTTTFTVDFQFDQWNAPVTATSNTAPTTP